MTVCTNAKPHTCTSKNKSSTITIGTSLKLNIRVMIIIDSGQNKVPADQYHVTILLAQVKNSLRLHVFLKLTTDQVLVKRLGCGLKPGYFFGGERGSTCKAKCSGKLAPDALLIFLPTHSLHNCLLESP